MPDDISQENEISVPRNIRQIGQIQEEYRIYVEDYVTTYLNQIAAGISDKSQAVLLLGQIQEQENCTYFFARGAICSEKEYELMHDVFFDEETKEYFNRVKEQFFPKMEVIGWALIKGELGRLSQDYIAHHILQDTVWDHHIFMEIDKYNCIDRFYLCGAPNRRACSGYFVFYDKNEEMQNYLIRWNEQKGMKKTVQDTDRTARFYREALVEKKNTVSESSSSGVYLVGMAAMIMLVVMAITSFNNYEKLSGLESTMEGVAGFINEQIEIAGNSLQVTHTDDIGSEVQKDPASDSGMGNEPVSSDESANLPENILPDAELSNPVTADPASSDPASSEDVSAADLPENSTSAESDTEGNNAEDNLNSDAVTTDAAEYLEETNTEETTSPVYTVYVIQKGDTLVSISREKYGSIYMVDEICELNGIEDGDTIFYGQKILLP